MTDEPGAGAFNEILGERLRLARRSRGWALSDVETASDGMFKASVVGAYERGERALTVHRLVRLASMYGVSVETLLPEVPVFPEATIDLTSVERAESADGLLVDRYLGTIQMMRRGSGGEMTVRSGDLRLLSAMLTESRLPVERQEL